MRHYALVYRHEDDFGILDVKMFLNEPSIFDFGFKPIGINNEWSSYEVVCLDYAAKLLFNFNF